MIVALRLEVPDGVRQLLRRRMGGTGLATRADVTREVRRLWDTYTQHGAAPTPLAPAEAPKPERERVSADLALFTTDTLRGEVARRERHTTGFALGEEGGPDA